MESYKLRGWFNFEQNTFRRSK